MCLTKNGEQSPAQAGFTLIELLVVLAIISTLMALVSPAYFKNDTRARETVLRHNLAAMRHALDDYRGDHGRSPATLQALVAARYLREIPLDPVLGKRDGWVAKPAEGGGVGDVASAAPGKSLDGSSYASW